MDKKKGCPRKDTPNNNKTTDTPVVRYFINERTINANDIKRIMNTIISI
jgi:hypothetical protein